MGILVGETKTQQQHDTAAHALSGFTTCQAYRQCCAGQQVQDNGDDCKYKNVHVKNNGIRGLRLKPLERVRAARLCQRS